MAETKIQKAIAEFKRIQSTDISLKDTLYLDGVLAVLENIDKEPEPAHTDESITTEEIKALRNIFDEYEASLGGGENDEPRYDWVATSKSIFAKLSGVELKRGDSVICSDDHNYKDCWFGLYIGKHPRLSLHVVLLRARPELKIHEEIAQFCFCKKK